MFVYKAKLVRVIDGDTIDAIIDLGFDVHVKKRIRLWGIDAPESRTKDLQEKRQGKKAYARLATILALSGNVFTIRSHGVGKFGRCLGEIFVEGEEKSVNKQLLSEGLAKEYNK